MRILYIGGVWHCEYSLYRESLISPSLDVLFCSYFMTAGHNLYRIISDLDYLANIGGHLKVNTRNDIDRVKALYKPDLTIFRNFCDTEYMIQDDELLWKQEINPRREDGNPIQFREMPKAKLIATQSEHRAKEKGWHYLPYCVSKDCEYTAKESRDIDIMLATKLPPISWGGEMKLKGMDILVQPVLKMNYTKKLYLYDLSAGLLPSLYLGHITSYVHPLAAIEQLKRAKIYLSPSTVWYDTGYISHKTLQALGCGCLVMTNKVAGIEDVFGKDGENLLYSESQQETREKIDYYLANEEERRKITKRGVEYAHENFSWGQHLKRIREEIK